MKIELVSAVTKNCLKDFLLMKKSLEMHHDVNFNVACDAYCFEYLNGNFKNVQCEQFITSEGADHVRGGESEKQDFIQIIKSKFDVAMKVLSSSDFILWCDVDHIFFNKFEEKILDISSTKLLDAALTTHFSDGFADEKTVGYYNCGFVFISKKEFLEMWSRLFNMHKELNLYFEQKPLELCTQSFNTMTLPINYNIGWWKFMGANGEARQKSIAVEDTIKFMGRDLINFHFNFFKETKHGYNQESFRDMIKQLLRARGTTKDQILLHEIERLSNEDI